jgi:deoxyribose-phosphate aldolase
MSKWNVPDLIDHTVLRPDATKIDVLRLCQEAKEFGFSVIFVPPCYVDEAVAAVAGTARPKLPKPLKRSRAARGCWIWS